MVSDAEAKAIGVGASMSMQDQKRFLVEWYRPELTVSPCERSAAALCASAARMSAQGVAVRLEAMLAVPSDEVVFAIFAADSANVVAQICEQTGLPVQRLTPAIGIRLPGQG